MSLQTVLYFLMWGGFFFVMMRFGCGSHIMGHGHHHGSKPNDARGSTADNAPIASDKGVDPVCGKTVLKAEAKTAAYGGHIYYFCSSGCRETFEAQPASYVTAATGHQPEERHHGCC
ncbi:MAG: hypothetical protein B7Z77_00980 [Acidocella sp. 20-58-15]|nr:MAG: hypothetical protein B7Z77_00980 [Acidocella sp. 20-58-15]